MKTKIAILYGGRSVEHGVSINSARNIYEFLDKELFEPILIGISTKGIWYKTKSVHKDIEQGEVLTVRLDPTHPCFLTPGNEEVKVDLVFPVLHGTDGEDGSIQGLLKALSIPMIGTGVMGSAMAMNKLVAKRVMEQAGIPVAPYLFSNYQDRFKFSFEEITQKLGLPFMVKSASLGSSVGVSKVKTKEEFLSALEDSFRYDDCVLFEKYIKAREIECAVLGNAPAQASLPGEIVISNKYEFYSFDAKYVDGDAVKIDVPASLPKDIAEKIRTLSLLAYEALGCEDFARVDLFLTSTGDVFVNEINTIPGFTNSSMFPMMWKERGISFTQLISKLAELARERHKHLQRVVRDFNSSLKY